MVNATGMDAMKLPLTRRALALITCLPLLVGCGGQGKGAPTNSDSSETQSEPQAPQKDDDPPAHTDDKKPSKQTQSAVSGLDRALALAEHSLKTLEKVKDYIGIFAKRELVGGVLSEERDKMKVRHEPFSIYLKVIKPASSAGQEAIYVEGRNNGNLVAHTVGFGSSLIGRPNLDPEGIIAKRGNRYTIKDAGLKNLVKKLIDLGGRKDLFRDSTVKIETAEFAERPCTQVEISSPRPVGDFRMATARIAIDKEWDVPVLYEAYEWPADGGKPFLSETYSYFELEFNVGLTDRDFDPDNPDYAYP
jgi:hypothetical protein